MSGEKADDLVDKRAVDLNRSSNITIEECMDRLHAIANTPGEKDSAEIQEKVACPLGQDSVDVYEYEKNEQMLHFNASSVAGICGFHKYADTIENVCQHLYQDLPKMQLADAKVLKMKLMSKEEELDQLIKKTGAQSAKELRDIVKWAARLPLTKQPVDLSKRKVVDIKLSEVLERTKAKKKMKKEEIKQLERDLRSKINTTVGKCNENSAVAAYEKQNRTYVYDKNDNLYVLEFPYHYKLNKLCTIEEKTKRKKISPASASKYFRRRHHQGQPEYFFTIRGKVDGLADLLIPDETGGDDFGVETIVVEVKNRMSCFFDPIPVYDQIQAAVYMKMVGCRQTDFIQSMNHDKAHISVTRLSLQDAPWYTGTAWKEVFTPRLYKYAEMIYTFRENAILRLSFLNGTREEQMKLITTYCPFLEK